MVKKAYHGHRLRLILPHSGTHTPVWVETCWNMLKHAETYVESNDIECQWNLDDKMGIPVLRNHHTFFWDSQNPCVPWSSHQYKSQSLSIKITQNHSKSLSGWWLTYPFQFFWKSIGMIIPNIWKHKKCLKPPTSCFTWYDRKRPSRYLLAFGHLVIHSLTHLPHISTSPVLVDLHRIRLPRALRVRDGALVALP
jgi:hypothetical protein